MSAGTLDPATLVEASRTEILDDVLVRICKLLQLSPTQFTSAEQHYHAICDWLSRPESALSRFRPELYPQGSMALGTTVKPQGGDEYDVDLVCELAIDYRTIRRPVLLLDVIESRMRENDSFRNRLERKKRCLRVNYQGDFHLDILPACPDRESGPTCLVIPDREDQNWQASNPRGFIQWFSAKGALRRTSGRTQKAMDAATPLPNPQTAEEKTTLQLSVQLIKRWRDIHYFGRPEFAPVSVVLSTLLGDYYTGEQSVSVNLAESIDSVLASLPQTGRLIVVNPSHPQEDLSERWEDAAVYQAFVEGIRVFRRQMQELTTCNDLGRQSELAQAMFGEKITKTAFEEQARTIKAFRESQRMKINKTAGVVSLSATAGTLVPRHTFYGDRGPQAAH